MNFIKTPNIPTGNVKVCIVDGRIQNQIQNKFVELGIEFIKTNRSKGLYDGIAYHPDIMFHHLGGKDIVISEEVDFSQITRMLDLGFNVSLGKSHLSMNYPNNIAYNVARIGKYAFHHSKYTDEKILQYFEQNGIELIHIKQGYSKCSISIVDENSIITMDKGIEKAAIRKGLDVLFIEEDQILLEGMNYGFIGGATGLLSKDIWAISGNIERLKEWKKIYDFLNSKHKKVLILSDGPVYDIGSILPLMESGTNSI